MEKIKNRKQNRRMPIKHSVAESLAQESRKDNAGFFGKLLTLDRRGWLIVGIIALVALGALGAGLKYLEDDARRQSADGSLENADPKQHSLLNRINPFISPPPPLPTPQLSKEYIYAGGKMLAVEDVNANAAPPADLAVWRPGTGTWLVMGGSGSQQTGVQWGTNNDTTVPGDYDGDGKTDFSVFRASTGYWYIQRSSDLAMLSYYFGASTDKVAPADYDGDGRTDAAVFRPSDGSWYIQRSSDGGLTAAQFGLSSDDPAPADYDGDGKADIAVWRSSAAQFYVLKSSDGVVQTINVWQTGGKPVPADYDGDGRADAATWGAGPYQNQWHVITSSGAAIEGISFGVQASDVPVQNDYDGDGKVDRALWRGSTGTWYILQSTQEGQTDYLRQTVWGQNGDVPVPAFYRR